MFSSFASSVTSLFCSINRSVAIAPEDVQPEQKKQPDPEDELVAKIGKELNEFFHTDEKFIIKEVGQLVTAHHIYTKSDLSYDELEPYERSLARLQELNPQISVERFEEYNASLPARLTIYGVSREGLLKLLQEANKIKSEQEASQGVLRKRFGQGSDI